jgi:hypothetical protein
MGGMGNVVVNTIVRMFTRKAVGKAMKSAKKSMGHKKGKPDGDHKERPNKRAPRTRRSSTKGTAGFRKGGNSEMGRGRAVDEGRPVESDKARASGSGPDAVEVHRAGGDHDDERPRARGLGPEIPAAGPGVAESYAAGTSGQRITREEMRRAARDGVVDREEELKGDGAYGSSTSDPILPAALAELVGTFILVFGGTAVAVGAILSRPTAGAAYDSLAVALAFGLALAAVVAAIGHVSGAHVNPAVTLGMASTGQFPWKSVPAYLGAQLVGAVLGAIGTWIAFGGPGRNEAKL